MGDEGSAWRVALKRLGGAPEVAAEEMGMRVSSDTKRDESSIFGIVAPSRVGLSCRGRCRLRYDAADIIWVGLAILR